MPPLRALVLFLALAFPLAADPVLHHGVNLGNMLEVPPGQHWNEHLQPGYFRIIHNAGFDTIRVPIDWVDEAGPAPDYTIDPAFFMRIDEVVASAKANQLNAILDYHTDPELMKYGDHFSDQEPFRYTDRFVQVWEQVAIHYARAPESVLFELLNEPHGALDAGRWNSLVTRVLSEIRSQPMMAVTEDCRNATRTILVGPVQWNSFDKLPELQLPADDRHLLVTFHYYLPMTFTHQGASWIDGSQAWLGNTWAGTDAQRAVIAHDFGAAADWAKAHHRPLFLGEFGAFSRGEMNSRARWTACCARTAEGLGMGWSYWEFCSGFGAYDPAAKQWRVPLLQALIPAQSN